MNKRIEKCDGCGNNMQYEPETQDLACVHCGKHIAFENQPYENNKSPLDLTEEVEVNKTVICNCPNCGANNELNENSISYKCNHCGTPIVLNEFAEDINALVPFKISKQIAKQYYKKWLKKRWFAPNSLKKLAELDKIEGHYIPVWAFDANTHTKYSGVEVRTRTVTRFVNGKPTTHTVSERFPFRGTRNDDFKDILVTGNAYITNDMLEKLEPFDYKTLKLYTPEYLMGCCVDTFSIPLINGYKTAKSEMQNRIENSIRATKSGRIEGLKMDTSYNDQKQARFLVPIWSSVYKYKNKDYKFYINGCTGEVHGSYPKSPWKIFFASLLGIAVIIGVVVLVTIYG